ncbi:DUF418 domain-containing protein [Tsuneonella amylolytica]|uniref:DUF418 domain-containing protein n=1 Tax=Tsuneonella amylolytica TaxID=2338327 RepID=UPI000EAA6B70|nr:DUF418 domain-containing protein [Tsuneonella amylolytica]
MTDATIPATPDQPQGAAPVGGDRLTSLDFTRGIAVMGILAANIVAFGQPPLAYTWPEGFLTPRSAVSDWLWLGQFVAVDGKMRGLFTLLFGAGLVLFMDRAWARGAGLGLQVRRLLWMLAFGLAHYYLLWRGDILAIYALCGLAVLPCVRWRPVTQMAVGLTGYVFGALLSTLSLGYLWASSETGLRGSPGFADGARAVEAMIAGERSDGARELAIRTDGSWLDMVAHTAESHTWDWLLTLGQIFTETIPLMLIGMAFYRAGVFAGRLDARRQAMWGWAGLAAGTAATLLLGLWVMGGGFTYARTLFAFIGASLFTRLPAVLGLAALLALWGPKVTGWLGSRTVAAGRMAFSNYLGTSLVMLFVFSGWAFGLYGKLDRPQLYLVVLATWVLMLAWSKPWLARYRYGPLEWLWRCLTYGRMFPLQR